jgi:vacuolar-type H+-ATPase subunit E/Vma4
LSIYRVIDKLEAHVREGTWLPFGYRILSEERLIEYVEKMRSTLPEEFANAKTIATNKERIVRDAQEKAQKIVTEAVAQKNELVEQQDVVRVARTTADVVLREAEEKARKIRAGADAYAAQVLAELEARLTTAIGSVQKGREALDPRPAHVAASEPIVDAAAKSKRAAFDAQNPQTQVREPVNVI